MFKLLGAAVGLQDAIAVNYEQSRYPAQFGGLLPKLTRFFIDRHKDLWPRQSMRLASFLDFLGIVVEAYTDDFQPVLLVLLVEIFQLRHHLPITRCTDESQVPSVVMTATPRRFLGMASTPRQCVPGANSMFED